MKKDLGKTPRLCFRLYSTWLFCVILPRINLFNTTAVFLYPLKTLKKKKRFFDVFGEICGMKLVKQPF